MAPQNNLERRAAKKLVSELGINYTAALRKVRSSHLKPSEIINSSLSVTVRKTAPDLNFPEVLEGMLREVNEDNIVDRLSNDRMTIWTRSITDNFEREHFISSQHLAISGGTDNQATKALSHLLLGSDVDESNIIAWDAGCGLSTCQGVNAHTDIHDFYRDLEKLVQRSNGSRNKPAIVAIDNIDSLLFQEEFESAEQGEVVRKITQTLIKILVEGRRRNIAVYVASSNPPYGSAGGLLSMSLRTAAQVIIITGGGYSSFPDEQSKNALPPLVQGRMHPVASSSSFRVLVPSIDSD